MNHDHKKHVLIMLACCLVPFALILVVSVFGLSLGVLQPLVPFALALLCPLMMIFMMRGTLAPHASAGPGHNHGTAPQPTKAQTAPVDSKPPKETTQCH